MSIYQTKLTIVYTGHIYYQQDPTKIMQALRELIDEGSIDPFDILVHFYGDTDKIHDLDGIVMWHDTVPHEIALEKQRAADILLLLKWEDTEEDGVYPAKVFEYLGARRPILATGGHNDVVTELLAETNAGVDCPTVEDIKRQLMTWLKEVSND